MSIANLYGAKGFPSIQMADGSTSAIITCSSGVLQINGSPLTGGSSALPTQVFQVSEPLNDYVQLSYADNGKEYTCYNSSTNLNMRFRLPDVDILPSGSTAGLIWKITINNVSPPQFAGNTLNILIYTFINSNGDPIADYNNGDFAEVSLILRADGSKYWHVKTDSGITSNIIDY